MVLFFHMSTLFMLNIDASASRFEYLICNRLFHQVHFTLLEKLQQCIMQWHDHHDRWSLLLWIASQTFKSMGAPAYCHRAWNTIRGVLQRRLDQEGVTLRREIEILAELWREQEESVTLHLQEVVLILPNERYVLELIYTVPLLSDSHSIWTTIGSGDKVRVN